LARCACWQHPKACSCATTAKAQAWSPARGWTPRCSSRSRATAISPGPLPHAQLVLLPGQSRRPPSRRCCCRRPPQTSMRARASRPRGPSHLAPIPRHRPARSPRVDRPIVTARRRAIAGRGPRPGRCLLPRSESSFSCVGSGVVYGGSKHLDQTLPRSTEASGHLTPNPEFPHCAICAAEADSFPA